MTFSGDQRSPEEPKMKALLYWTLAFVVALSEFAQAQSPAKKGPNPGSDKERLVGAWHLVSMEEPGADGKVHRITDRKGMLIYTTDGHVSVQLMLPESESRVSNDYVLNGYEASFGSYDVDEAAHSVTHHVQGSITPGLWGKTSRAFTG